MSEPVSEPTPPEGEHVPPAVLDELRAAFAGPEDAPGSTAGSPTGEPTAPTGEPTAPTGAPADTPLPAEPAPAPRRTIVIGGDDELPDAMYLEATDPAAGTARADRQGPPPPAVDPSERGTIVIGHELEASGAFDAVALPSPAMDPRLKARRASVQRAKGRRRLLWAAAIAAVVLVAVAVLAVFASSLFAVETVDVHGAVYTSSRNGEQLQAVIDEMMGEPVLLVDTTRAERALEQIPWVERAFVRTDFPHRVVIDIRERHPLATYQGSDQRFRVVDADGRVLDVLDGRPVDYMLVLLSSAGQDAAGPDLEAGSLAGGPLAEAAQLVGALPAELRAIARSASVDATTGDLGLVLVGPPDDAAAQGAEGPDVEVRLGTIERLDAKLARLLQQVRDGLAGVARLDVSTDEVVLTPAP